MNDPSAPSGWLALILAIFGGGAGLAFSDLATEHPAPFSPAYFEPGSPPRLTIFPADGPATSVALPAGLPANFRAIAFSPDGRAIYGQTTEPLNPSAGILKIEFQPARQSLIPGSVGTGEVRCLTASPLSGRIMVSGWSWSRGEAGTFEIDPAKGTSRPLAAAAPSVCGGPGGLTSPDGMRVMSRSGKQLGLRDSKTGAAQTINGVSPGATCEWSPDGLRIICVSDRKLILLDADNPSTPERLGTLANSPVVWSPDSKRLLLIKSEASCLPTLYGRSLEIVDLRTGKRTPVKSSQCRILSGTIGWLSLKAQQ